MSGILSIAALIVGGVIVADILTHPAGTAAASNGLMGLWGSSLNGLLGKTNNK
jgi:hypothetical protein